VLEVLTWHVHGSYLLSLASAPVRWILPRDDGRFGYGGRAGSFPWPANVVEVPVSELASVRVDAVLYQHPSHYAVDRHEVLSERQRAAPALYVEHDPPRCSPTDTVHPVDDGTTTVVHVTHFNDLMWDTRSPHVVIEHGVAIPATPASLRRPTGVAVINDLRARGRRLGADVYTMAREHLDVDLIGAGAEEFGGRGEVPPEHVMSTVADYRFLFSPIRYTSLGLGILEAMAAGLPVVGLATTELATVIDNGVNGFVHTDVQQVMRDGRRLLEDRSLALQLGSGARATVRQRYSLERFARDWVALLERSVERR
jgi:hypothetical protein